MTEQFVYKGGKLLGRVVLIDEWSGVATYTSDSVYVGEFPTVAIEGDVEVLKVGDPFPCPHCGASGEWKADYYESVWQTISLHVGDDGQPFFGDYTGVTGHYDDGATEDEAYRCSSCSVEMPVHPILISQEMRGLAEALVAAEDSGSAIEQLNRAAHLARLILGNREEHSA